MLCREFLNYTFVGLPETATAREEYVRAPQNVPFQDVGGTSLDPWRSQMPKVVDGILESTIQLLSVEIQVNTLSQTKAPTWTIYCWCESCQTLVVWGESMGDERVKETREFD